MKFTIITPTVMRSFLKRACRSIEEGSHRDWEHLVVVDDYLMEVPKELLHQNRHWYCCGARHRSHGNICRSSMYKYITGDIVLYLDDDEFYINDALALLNEHIGEAQCGVFPVLLKGARFINPCLGDCCTTNCQIFHRPMINGVEVRYIGYNIESADGKLAQGLKYLAAPLILMELPELICIEGESFGKRPGDEKGTIWGEVKK